ncbi:4Fe-4S dicluster domain-containing protein [Geothrix edaphica]|uniref:Fe-S-cluster-containing hydrogenase n=1 Tax=Geothrix edaphica TaxID=2927976 RepID=A0ABQ5PZ44_9BACT|nr:4Fe-4S dicluster domain-containing protein [Geothrix edaphica]GLH67379.1 Fe-S-cluster-containing hydrogenase [Geothrix edaphica]
MKTWKSLGERRGMVRARKAEFEDELPVGESVRQISRRDFFRFSGVGFAAGLALGCKSKVVEKAMPYLNAREGLTPGVAQWYATTCGGCAAGCGVLARSRDGRPVKLEGNPEHPVSRGGLCAMGQAQTRGLYDEDRLRGPKQAGKAVDWAALDADLQRRFTELRTSGGAIRVLAGTILSPTLRAAVQGFLGTFKDGRLVEADALSAAALAAAYEHTHGQRVMPHYRLEEADLTVGVEADFLGTWIDPVGFTRAYAERRGPDKPRPMSKHIQVESGLSLTGSNADERVRLAPSEAVPFLEVLARQLGLQVEGGTLPTALTAKAQAIAHELEAHRGHGLLLCGLNDPRAQEVVARINHALGHEGTTVDLARPSLQKRGDDRALEGLVREMAEGKVAALLLLGCNPVYEQPMVFGEAFAKVPLRVSLALTEDESAAACTHLAPDQHWLETWRDAEPVAGTVSLIQPLLQPLFATRDAVESFGAWAGRPVPALQALREHWKAALFPRQKALGDFDTFWNAALQKGAAQVEVGPAPRYREGRVEGAPKAARKDGYELLLYAKVGLGDGRHAHIPFLQELPDPITKATWDNYAQVSPAAAARLGLEQGDLLHLRPEGHVLELELPVVVQPGQDDRTVAVALGYGRTAGGKAGLSVGKNAYPWRTFTSGFLAAEASPLQVRRGSGRVDLACTQDHHSLEGRELVREMALAPYLRDPASARPHEQPGPSVYGEHLHGAHRWAMVIDLSACTGCSGCVIGCQVENNIPVVGRDEVRRKREMHWLRIDRYYTGSEAEPGVVHQPMMCQQCDQAPCENVCPVLATVHSEEGLNQQVYNRCVGTRYCANNCPYKVRRFNWWEYPHASELERLGFNPDVTVRSRGVMEKCSFCVQRLLEAKLTAKNEGRELKDGEAMPACMQSCPAQAIVFGDTQDPDSRISQVLRDPKRFLVLGELGIGPAVSYLTKIRNVATDTNQGGHHGA